MNGKYLLDTNIIIALFLSEEKVIQEINNAEEICVPIISLGELYYGAYNSQRIEENILNIKEFSKEIQILKADSITADYYGQVKSVLKKNGNPIPENDIWIASLAIQYGLTLVTRDKHFSNVPNLEIEIW